MLFIKKRSLGLDFSACPRGQKIFGKKPALQREAAQIWWFKWSFGGVQLSFYCSSLQIMTTITTDMVTCKVHAHLLCMHFQPLKPCADVRYFFFSLLPSFFVLKRGHVIKWCVAEIFLKSGHLIVKHMQKIIWFTTDFFKYLFFGLWYNQGTKWNFK